MTALHQPGAAFTAIALVLLGSVGASGAPGLTQVIMGDDGFSTQNAGMDWDCNAVGASTLRLVNTSNGMPALLASNTAEGFTTGTMAFHAIAYDGTGAAPSLTFALNGSSQTTSPLLTGPSSMDASCVFQIGAAGGGSHSLSANSRLGMLAVLNGALSADQLSAVYNAVRSWYGI